MTTTSTKEGFELEGNASKQTYTFPEFGFCDVYVFQLNWELECSRIALSKGWKEIRLITSEPIHARRQLALGYSWHPAGTLLASAPHWRALKSRSEPHLSSSVPTCPRVT